MSGLVRRVGTATAASALIVVGLAGPASAHAHGAAAAHQGVGQVLANGQTHATFVPVIGADGRESCGGDPAAYGLETAHHGPDAGSPGKGDGCYQTDAWPLTSDINNTHIR